MIDPRIIQQIELMAQGIQEQIDRQGRPMLASEQATMMVCFSFQETAKWLFKTLNTTADDRFDLGIQLDAWCKEMLGEI